MINPKIVIKLKGNLIPMYFIANEIELENMNMNAIPNQKLPHLKKCLKSVFLSLNLIYSARTRSRKTPPKR